MLRAVLSDMQRKSCTASLDRFPPVLFNIKEMGHGEFSEVTGRTLANLKVCYLNARFLSSTAFMSTLKITSPLLSFKEKKKKHLYFILSVS